MWKQEWSADGVNGILPSKAFWFVGQCRLGESTQTNIMCSIFIDDNIRNWQYLGAGTGVGLSPSGEGGREERMGEVGTIFEALGSLGGSSAQPICGELAFTLVLGTGGWGGGWDGG